MDQGNVETGTTGPRTRRGSTRSLCWLAVSVAAMVAAADVFFYGHAPGWTLGAYAGLALALLLTRDPRPLHRRGGSLLVAAVLGLCLALGLDASLLGLLLVLFGLGSLRLLARSRWERDPFAWAGRWVAMAISITGRVDVFVARIAEGLAICSNSLNSAFFTARSSTTDSMIRSHSASRPRWSVAVIRPRIASRSPGVIFSFSTCLARPLATPAREASAAA